MPLTALVGREQELAALVSLLRHADVRLVTLTGPGGVGKTRLALEVGARLRGHFADGVVFVDLAPLIDADLVIPAVASALGVRERSGQRLLDTLATVLARKHLLLIVDNVERVLAAAPDVAALLIANPRAAILATSREALRVRGEREVPLLPLPLPAADRSLPIAELAQVPAVALFVARATANHRAFALVSDNASAVTAICRRVDGLPLAIELAAARIRILPPAELRARLEHRLPLLTGGSRDLPPRQRTMRDAIAWSYDLLSPDEQALFRRLAVFAGGWTLEAADAVAAADGALDIVDGLQALISASLVQSVEQPDGERRFTMLETVREFGLERLVASGEAQELGRHHADYYLVLAQAAGASHAPAAPGEWLVHLEEEEPNLRAALTWLRDQGGSRDGLRLAGALGGFWRLRSANTEGRAWLETFLAQPAADEASIAARIVALRWAGELAGLQGDAAAAEARLRESLALARTAGDTRAIAAALGAIGSALLQHGDVAGSLDPFAEAALLSRELGDTRQAAFLLAYRAVAVGHQGDLTRAETLLAESEELLCSLDDVDSFEANLALLARGLLALMGGAYDRAKERCEEALALGQALDAKAILSVTFACLGEVAQARGEVEAAQHYRGGLKAVAAAYENHVATMQAGLGEEAFARAREAGRTLPLDEVVVEALRLAEERMGD